MTTCHFNAGQRLVMLMQARGDTPSSLARKLGTTRQQVFRYKNNPDMKVSTMLNICQAYGITPMEFISAEVDN